MLTPYNVAIDYFSNVRAINVLPCENDTLYMIPYTLVNKRMRYSGKRNDTMRLIKDMRLYGT